MPMAEVKKPPCLNACIIGHVDSGKSTTVGMFALAKGMIDQRAYQKFKTEAENHNKPSFALAYFTDNTEAERKRGITIQNCLKKFEMNNYHMNIIDCPGHKDFIKNMVTGAAQADVGIAMVPAPDFEASVSPGATLKDHFTISGVLGVGTMICCINKMDCIEESQRKAKFEEIVGNLRLILSRCSPYKNAIMIPISGFKGIGLTEDGPKFDWFEGYKYKPSPSSQLANAKVDADGFVTIYTLEGALDAMAIPVRPVDKPLRMPITEIHTITGFGLIYTGRVDSGLIRPGMQVNLQPSNVMGEVKTLQIHRQDQKEVVCGENVGLALKSGAKGSINQIKKGNVISDAKNQPAQIYQACKARVIVVEHPRGIKVGYAPVMDLGSHHVPVKFAKFVSKSNAKNKTEEPDPEEIKNKDLATVILVPQKPTVMEKVTEFPTLARFCIRDSSMVVAIGTILECYDAQQCAELGIDIGGKKAEVSRTVRRAG